MRIFTIITVLLAIVGIQSCVGSASKLAHEIEGKWTSRPENLNIPGATASQATFTYTFHRNAGERGGIVELSALIDLALPAGNNDGSGRRAISVSASAVAMATGTWHATTDNEIYLLIDPQSVRVDIDPTSVVAHSPEDAASSTGCSLPAAAGMLQHEVAGAVERKVATMQHLNDIKLDNDGRTLQWKANYTECTLRRQ